MNQASSFERDAASSSLAPVRFVYADTSVDAALAAPGTLAVLAFGADAPTLNDPRYLRVGLAPLGGDTRIETWRVQGPVRHGRDGDVRWSADADWLFGAIEIDEAAAGGIEAASHEAYRQLCAFTARGGHRHMLRIWNYLDAINEGPDDAERYRLFCRGRAEGIDGSVQTFPAASAIGRRDGVRVLQVYWLAARLPGEAVENPRQVSAWRYPRQYGPTAPTFARGMRSPSPAAQLHVSGTAAVVGHASQHDDDLSAQLEETFNNLHSLFANARCEAGFGATSLVKAYVRRSSDAVAVADALARRLPAGTPWMLLEGDICRRELLVEIDGVVGV